MATGDSTLLFDGQTSYVEIADSADFSVATTGQLSVSAWIRPDVLPFPAFQSTGYIHWTGKGAQGFSHRRFNSEVQQRCIDDMAEHRGWGKGRGQGRKSPAAMRA